MVNSFAQPNNRMLWYEQSLTPKELKRPDFQVSTRNFFCEQESKWAFGDSNDYFYEDKERDVKEKTNTIMSKSVLNKDKNLDATKQPMFFGPDLQIQRYDNMKYPIFDKLNQQQLGYFWRPEEVSLQKDRNDYLELRDEQKFIFTSNLKYQTMLDSVQGRGPCLAFLPFCSLPELEGCIVTWDFIETIHSRSYTYIIKNLYSQPSDVFDTIIEDEKIKKERLVCTKTYDDLIKMGYQWTLTPDKVDLYELKKKLYLSNGVSKHIRGLRFYVSFACSFAFGELKKLELC